MQEDELYVGFNKEKHDKYVKELIDCFGEEAKIAIAESEKNVKNWTKKDFEKSKKPLMRSVKKSDTV